jgi:lipopolysaccharide/colanic/teichoic acid biosynthesis glycosyltransferase
MSELLFPKALIKDETISELDEILKKRRGQLIIKRFLDMALSLVGIVCLLPVFLLISIIIKADTKGPVIFKQVRVGRNGSEFKILKFRTMIVDAEEQGMQITVGNDCRITRAGSFLRKTKLDELPQLFNVFLGDMSFVGPRPEVSKYVALYNDTQRRILQLRPGITDIASIEYRDENTLLAQSNDPEKEYIEEIMPKKLDFNIKYLHNISITYDIWIILKTIFVVIRQK